MNLSRNQFRPSVKGDSRTNTLVSSDYSRNGASIYIWPSDTRSSKAIRNSPSPFNCSGRRRAAASLKVEQRVLKGRSLGRPSASRDHQHLTTTPAPRLWTLSLRAGRQEFDIRVRATDTTHSRSGQ